MRGVKRGRQEQAADEGSGQDVRRRGMRRCPNLHPERKRNLHRAAAVLKNLSAAMKTTIETRFGYRVAGNSSQHVQLACAIENNRFLLQVNPRRRSMSAFSRIRQ